MAGLMSASQSSSSCRENRNIRALLPRSCVGIIIPEGTTSDPQTPWYVRVSESCAADHPPGRAEVRSSPTRILDATLPAAP